MHLQWSLRAHPVRIHTNIKAKRLWPSVQPHVELLAPCLYMLSRETQGAHRRGVTVIVSQGQKRMEHAPTTPTNTTSCTSTQTRRSQRPHQRQVNGILIQTHPKF